MIDSFVKGAALRAQIKGQEWMAEKPEQIFVGIVEDRLIGAALEYVEPPAYFAVNLGEEALVACFHSDQSWDEPVIAGGIERKSQYGDYSYEIRTVRSLAPVSVTVDTNSPVEATCYGSCPWVYLDGPDGEQRVDEILKDIRGPGAATWASLELPHTSGRRKISVRIAEELRGEVSHIDALRLRIPGHNELISPSQSPRLVEVDGRWQVLKYGESASVDFVLPLPAPADVRLEAYGYYETMTR